MKQTIVILFCFLILGCKSEIKPNKINLADINLIVKTDRKIDSVWVSNIGQTESYLLQFQDTLKVNFNNELNDLYRVIFYTEKGKVDNQLWLDGNNVIISGKLNEKLVIDSIQNSDLNYKSIVFSKKYRELIKNKADDITIDNFLLENITQNVESPFSFNVANPYIYRNQNDKSKIGKLYDILSTQSDTLKNHFISIHGKIENILKVKFANVENQLTSIELDKPKTYLLDFWFINCPPCIKDHKLISKKMDFLKEKNVELIGISTDKNHSDWNNYLRKHNYNWKNYREIDSLKRVTKDMAIWSFPTYLVLNNNGEIKARYNSFEDFEKTIE
jgi:thiol-disulfide isomerase/thioredoxin